MRDSEAPQNSLQNVSLTTLLVCWDHDGDHTHISQISQDGKILTELVSGKAATCSGLWSSLTCEPRRSPLEERSSMFEEPVRFSEAAFPLMMSVLLLTSLILGAVRSMPFEKFIRRFL